METKFEKSSRTYFAAALVILTFVIVSVAAIMWINTANKTALFPSKEGVEPYRFSEHETELLRLLDLNGNAALLRIKAPKEARHLNFLVHMLKSDGTWDTSITKNDISWNDDNTSNQQLETVLALVRRDDYSIEMRCWYETGATSVLDGIPAPQLLFDPKSGSSVFLNEFQDIELDKEIPIAILALNKDSGMSSLSLLEYFDTSRLAGYDFVQVVTMTFSANP